MKGGAIKPKLSRPGRPRAVHERLAKNYSRRKSGGWWGITTCGATVGAGEASWDEGIPTCHPLSEVLHPGQAWASHDLRGASETKEEAPRMEGVAQFDKYVIDYDPLPFGSLQIATYIGV